MFTQTFSLDRRLGVGATAEVFLAHVNASGEARALKVFTPLVLSDADTVRRVRMEMEALQKLSHPNIVRLFGGHGNDKAFALELEYVDGSDLRAWRAKYSLPFTEPLFWILCQIARGLKPENVLVSKNGEVKLTDFGLARELDAVTMTKSGLLSGSIGYIAPEILSGEPADHRSDIFSFGAVAYELLSSKNPFGANTPQGSMKKLLAGEFLPLAESSAELPPTVVQIIEKCLALDPSLRPPSIWHIEGELQLALRSSPLARMCRSLVSTNERDRFMVAAYEAKRRQLGQRRNSLARGNEASIALARDWAHLFPSAPEPLEILQTLRKPAQLKRRLVIAAIALILLLPLFWFFPSREDAELDQVVATPAPTIQAKPIAAPPPAPAVSRPKIGWIKVFADPDVQLFLDEKLVPQEKWDRIEASAGLRNLKLVKEGFLPIVNAIEVKAGKVVVVKARGGS